MKLHVLHRTRFKYATPVHESFNEARLQPVSTGPQVCHSFVLKVLPAARLRHYLDFHRNCVHLFEVNQPHTELMVEASSVVTTGGTSGLPAEATPAPLEHVGECSRMERCELLHQD
jgi:transglutaminase-like putative cysteine protease